MSDQDELGEKVHKWLEKQGYPLEMRLAKIIRDRSDLSFRQGWNYDDPEQNKTREIDIICSKSDAFGLSEINFIFECKATSKPWVLFTSEETASSYHRLASFGLFTQPAFSVISSALFDLDDTEFRKAKSIPWLWKTESVGYSLVQAFEGNKDVAYSAVLSATKAALWLLSNSVWQSEGQLTYVACFPVVVTTSPLFECKLDSHGDTCLAEVSHGYYFFNKKMGDFSATCVAIVNEKHLEKFIDECVVVAKEVEEAMEPELKKIRDNLTRQNSAK